MKKWKFLLIALTIVTIIGMGLAGCVLDGESWDTGTLRIKNDTFALPDLIIRVIIREGNSSGDEVVNETVTIKSGENRTYSLTSGTYAVTIRTDLLFEYDRTVNISNGSTTTLTYDDSGLH